MYVCIYIYIYTYTYIYIYIYMRHDNSSLPEGTYCGIPLEELRLCQI